MSVLNQASDGLYTVLIALARAIVRFGLIGQAWAKQQTTRNFSCRAL